MLYRVIKEASLLRRHVRRDMKEVREWVMQVIGKYSVKVEETSNNKCPKFGLKEANVSEVRDEGKLWEMY